MEMEKIVSFLEEAEGLKSVLRTAYASSGRRESTAEHSWRLALLAGVMLEDSSGLDIPKTLMMCLIHDIGEIYEGDVSAALHPDKEGKLATETRAAQKVFSHLSKDRANWLMDIFLEYNGGVTPEAKLVKALDKAETILQHCQGRNPAGFDYLFNLEYGKEYFTQDEDLKKLRTLLDGKTMEKANADK